MYRTLISPEELLRHLNDTDWRIVDCRFDLTDTEAGRRAFHKQHIPGAVYAHLDEVLSGPIVDGKTGRHPLPSVAEAARRFGQLGIGNNTQVIAYDDKGGGVAARLWWMLRWLGHDNVAVLDGGWPAWMALSYPVETKEQQPAAQIFRPDPRPELSIDTAMVDHYRLDNRFVLVDSRTPERYRGEEEPIDPVAGHIPGARNLPFPDNLEGGRFRSSEALRERFTQQIGAAPAENTVFYCGSGVTACHNVLAYAHAGLGDARLYPGSWSEWITDADRAVATGEQ